MAAKSPEEAKREADKKTAAAEAKNKADKELMAKHLADLKTRFGEVGTDSGNIRVALDQNGNLVLQEFKYNEKGEPIDTREVFFSVANDGISFNILNGSAVIKKIKEGYKGNLEGLRKALYDKNFMSETDYVTKDENALNQAVLQSARNYSTYEVQKYTVEGQTKFNPYNKWLSGITSAPKEGKQPLLPSRDINLIDRDIIKALVEDVYMQENMQLPDDPTLIESKVDRYMDMIKKGTLTKYKEQNKAGERESTTSAGFSESRLRAELSKEIPVESPESYQKAQSLNFLSFLAQMEQR